MREKYIGRRGVLRDLEVVCFRFDSEKGELILFCTKALLPELLPLLERKLPGRLIEHESISRAGRYKAGIYGGRGRARKVDAIEVLEGLRWRGFLLEKVRSFGHFCR